MGKKFTVGKLLSILALSLLLAIQISPALPNFTTNETAFAQSRTAIPIAPDDCSQYNEAIFDKFDVQGSEMAERVIAKNEAKRYFTDDPIMTRQKQYEVIACSLKSGEFHLFMAPYMIRYFVEVIIQLAGLVCVLFIIIGAYQYLLGSVTENKQKGKDTIKNALIGLVITLLSWIIVNVIQVAVTGS